MARFAGRSSSPEAEPTGARRILKLLKVDSATRTNGRVPPDVAAGLDGQGAGALIAAASHGSTLPPDAQWEERMPANVCGVASALTTLAAMRAWKAWLMRLVFLWRRYAPRCYRRRRARPLRELSFIHFARWAFVSRFAGNEGWPDEDLGVDYLYFESNFNGTFDQYIDAFAYVIPRNMNGIWRGGYDFPGPKPATAFKDYIARNEFAAAHYYSAYPRATATQVTRALAAQRGLESLAKVSRHIRPEQFAERWRDLLATTQRSL